MGLFNRNKDPKQKQPWYKTVFKAFAAAVTISGMVWGVFEVIWVVAEWHQKEVALETKVSDLEKKLKDVISGDVKKDKQIDSLISYIESKKTSFAVGFRVNKITDEETGEITYKKMYRDWNGVWHEIHYDLYMSQTYGYDYYFYVDKNTGDKIYVIGNA